MKESGRFPVQGEFPGFAAPDFGNQQINGVRFWGLPRNLTPVDFSS